MRTSEAVAFAVAFTAETVKARFADDAMRTPGLGGRRGDVEQLTNDALALLRLAGQHARCMATLNETPGDIEAWIIRTARPYGVVASFVDRVDLLFPSGAVLTVPDGMIVDNGEMIEDAPPCILTPSQLASVVAVAWIVA